MFHKLDSLEKPVGKNLLLLNTVASRKGAGVQVLLVTIFLTVSLSKFVLIYRVVAPADLVQFIQCG